MNRILNSLEGNRSLRTQPNTFQFSVGSSPIPNPEQPKKPPGVLVVDDEELILILARRILQRSGSEVWVASNAQDAAQMCQQHYQDIDIVLVDLMMPICDGLACLDMLREIKPSLPCCFMSGNPGAGTVKSLLKKGAVDFLPKPFRSQELVTRITRLAEGALEGDSEA